MTIDRRTHGRAAEHVYARELDGELVLLDLAGGEYYGLDEIGARLWRGLESGKSIEEIVAAIAPEYDVTAEDLLGDLVALTRDLAERRLVVPLASVTT